MLKALQELLAEKRFKSRNVNVCAPGFHVFSKFVKLPPVDTSKVTQIIQYEAQQNVPFPLEEVVWDYQILGATATGELEVLLVAIKSDIVEGLFRVADNAGLRLQLVDVSPAALVQRVSLQLRRSRRLHDAAGYRGQDQQPAVLREGEAFTRAASTSAPTPSRRISPTNPSCSSTRPKRSRSRKGLSAWAALTKSRRTRTRRPFPRSRGRS